MFYITIIWNLWLLIWILLLHTNSSYMHNHITFTLSSTKQSIQTPLYMSSKINSTFYNSNKPKYHKVGGNGWKAKRKWRKESSKKWKDHDESAYSPLMQTYIDLVKFLVKTASRIDYYRTSVVISNETSVLKIGETISSEAIPYNDIFLQQKLMENIKNIFSQKPKHMDM
jgi:hypothetical protein